MYSAQKKINYNFTENYILDILKNKYKNLNTLRKCKVLEIGCGVGLLATQLCLFFKKYNAIDRDQEVIDIAKSNTHSLYENLRFDVYNIMNDNYTIKKKNIIIAINVVHFIKDFEKFFIKVNKILTKNGICIIFEPPIEPNGWGTNLFNETSSEFDINKWNFKKKVLIDEYEYIMNHTNAKYYEHKNCRIFIIDKSNH